MSWICLLNNVCDVEIFEFYTIPSFFFIHFIIFRMSTPACFDRAKIIEWWNSFIIFLHLQRVISLQKHPYFVESSSFVLHSSRLKEYGVICLEKHLILLLKEDFNHLKWAGNLTIKVFLTYSKVASTLC